MSTNLNQRMRFTRPDRLRICDYQSIEPGELFLVPSQNVSSQLALMIHVVDSEKTTRIPIWLSDPKGALIAPTFQVLEISDTTCASLGKQFEFLIDPLEPTNELDVMFDSVDGAGLSVIDGRLAIRAQPVPGMGYRRSMYADVRNGTLIPDSKLRVSTIVFMSWQLILPATPNERNPITLGTYAPAN